MSDEIQKNILTEIRARHEIDQRWRNGPSMICPQSHDDRGWLLSEIERLRVENNHLRRVGMDRPSAGLHKAAMAELRSENQHLREHRQLASIYATDARAKADKLRAENERLRARVEVLERLTRESLNVLTCDGGGDDDPGHRCSHCDDYVDRNRQHRKALRAALEAKP